MTEVMAYCRDRYSTLVLTTELPELYQPFGFRSDPEYQFTITCDAIGESHLRPLDFSAAEDIQRLHRLLNIRESVSQVLGVV